MDDLIRPSWNDVHEMTQKILVDVLTHNVSITNPFDCVVGITRGGLIPGVILSHELGRPLICADYSSPKGAGDDKRIERELPHIKNADSLLIVDDIADTGHTLFETGLCYLSRGHRVHTAALYWKTPNAADFVADFYAEKLPHDAPWVMFPWE